MRKHETKHRRLKNPKAKAVTHTETCIAVSHNDAYMSSITTNQLTGSEIKGNYANCGEFRVFP